VEQYVGVSDVLDHVDADYYVTAATGEREQFRGEWRFHRGSEPAYTLRTTSVSLGFVPADENVDDAERITDVEYERETIEDMKVLQSLPRSFEVRATYKTDKRRLLGNAVPPLLAQRLAESL
jgi:site-specific DNA-cytosine methylase